MAKGIKPKNSDEIILVDDEDYEWLNQYSWHISKTGYVYTSVWLRCKKKDRKFRMHRMILNRHGFDISSKETDHININKLDNRKENLRVCTRSENLRNKKKNPNRSMSSKYKGIQKTRFGTFSVLVGITVNGKGKIVNLGHFYDGRKVNYIGKFEDEEMAARAADKYIIENKLDWLYCKLNFKENINETR